MVDEIAPKTASQQPRSQVPGWQITRQKITWQKAGLVSEPGRYMFTFGWLIVTAEDIAVWRLYPQAQFTMLQLPKRPAEAAVDDGTDVADEYHLGTFELPGS